MSVVESSFGRNATGDQDEDEELWHDNLRDGELEKVYEDMTLH